MEHQYLFSLFQVNYDDPHNDQYFASPIIASDLPEYFNKIDTEDLNGYDNYLQIFDLTDQKIITTLLWCDAPEQPLRIKTIPQIKQELERDIPDTKD